MKAKSFSVLSINHLAIDSLAMRNHKQAIRGITAGIFLTVIASTGAVAQTTIAPPSLGQETKGTPAIEETQPIEVAESEAVKPKQKPATVKNGPFGSATIVESKRESGQRYLIELEHSSGAKQYIEETDSDGKIESTSNDIEETPNLPKWKLGSW